MNKKTLLIIAVVVLASAILLMVNGGGTTKQNPTVDTKPINTVSYKCTSGNITAAYYQGESKPAATPDMPPIPGGSIKLTLSDGRNMTLAQTISADGGRYANTDESIVFWDKGNSALFTENNKPTFGPCILPAKDPGGLSEVYTNATKGVSLRYPANFTKDEMYTYQALGPGKDISGVKFTIPQEVATGTNLSSDSYISVEQLAADECSATPFLDQSNNTHSIDENGTTYSIASSTDAAAGNRYEETVYALPGTNPCTAIRYFIHYGAIENYPKGLVKEFDKQGLVEQFDAIRKTLVIGK